MFIRLFLNYVENIYFPGCDSDDIKTYNRGRLTESCFQRPHFNSTCSISQQKYGRNKTCYINIQTEQYTYNFNKEKSYSLRSFTMRLRSLAISLNPMNTVWQHEYMRVYEGWYHCKVDQLWIYEKYLLMPWKLTLNKNVASMLSQQGRNIKNK